MFNWIKGWKREKKAAQTLSSVLVAPNSYLGYVLTGEKITSAQAMTFYRTNAAVATAVDLIAMSFEQIAPVLEMSKPNGVKIFDDGQEIVGLLKNPNGFQTWKELAGMISRQYLLKHDSHISGIGNVKRQPIELFSVKPQNVSALEDIRDGFPDRYIVAQGIGHGGYQRSENSKLGTRYYDGSLKELFHIMGFSSRGNNVEGDSPLEAAALSARQQIEGRIHNLKLIMNGARPSLIVSFKDEGELIGDDEHKNRKMRINEDLGGSNNAGKIAVISGYEVDITEVGRTNKDMDYVKLDETASKAIYLRYNIPLPLVTVTASTFNNMAQAVEHLYDFAVLPLADILFAGLSKMMFPRFGIDPEKNRLTYNPHSITALRSRTLTEIEKRRKVNIETTNELRASLQGREPIPGGDTLYQPANLVPVGTDLFTDDNANTPEEEARKLLDRDKTN